MLLVSSCHVSSSCPGALHCIEGHIHRQLSTRCIQCEGASHATPPTHAKGAFSPWKFLHIQTQVGIFFIVFCCVWDHNCVDGTLTPKNLGKSLASLHVWSRQVSRGFYWVPVPHCFQIVPLFAIIFCPVSGVEEEHFFLFGFVAVCLCLLSEVAMKTIIELIGATATAVQITMLEGYFSKNNALV